MDMNMASIEKSIALRLLKKRKEELDGPHNKKKRKALLEEVGILKEMIDPKYKYESWMFQDIEKIEKQLTEKEVSEEKWSNILNNNCEEIIEILEKRCRTACEGHNTEEIENTLYIIQVIKKHIGNEIYKSMDIEEKSNKNMISLDNQINNITEKLISARNSSIIMDIEPFN